MKIINAYIKGFKEALRQKKIVTIIYSVTLLLALAVVMPFKVVTTNNFSDKPLVFKLFNEFDFTALTDLINNHGDLIRPFITMVFWMGVVYFFFTVFFSGGILRLANEKTSKPSGKQFFGGCAKYFLPFLRLAFYILLIQLILAFLFSIILGLVMALFEGAAEPKLVSSFILMFILFLLFFWFVAIVSDYAKIVLVKEDSKKVWRAIGTGFLFAFKRFFQVYPLYLLFILFAVAISIVYLWVDSAIGMTNTLTVLLMFIIQQLMVWLRFFAKVWLITGEYEFFDEYYVERTQPMQTQEIILDENL